jgi:hypothetical protein
VSRFRRAREIVAHPSTPLIAGVAVAAVTGTPWLGAVVAIGGALLRWPEAAPWRRRPLLDLVAIGHDVAKATHSEAEARWVLEAASWKIARARKRHGPAAEATLSAIVARAWVLVELQRWPDVVPDVEVLLEHRGSLTADLRMHALAILARADGEAAGPEHRREQLERAWPRLPITDRAIVACACADRCQERGDDEAALAWVHRGFDAATADAGTSAGDPYREGSDAGVDKERADILVCLVATASAVHGHAADFRRALADIGRMVAIAENFLSHHAAHLARLEVVVARAEQDAGRHLDAIRRLERLTARPLGSADMPAIAPFAYAGLTSACLDVERHEAAAASARAGLEALSKVATSDAESAAGPLHRGLALAELRLGRLEAARAALGDDDDPGVRAELALAEGDLVVADARAREAVQAATGRWRADHPYVTESSELLARVLVAAERNADAIAILEPAIAILERSCGPEHPQLIGPLETLAHAVAGKARAAELRARASRLRAAMLA